MKYNKSEIIKRAWSLWRQSKRLGFDKKYGDTFANKLAQAWSEAKEAANPTTWAYVVPMWKWNEVELMGVRSNIVKTAQIEKETKKAFKVYGEWIPKSICEMKKVAA